MRRNRRKLKKCRIGSLLTFFIHLNYNFSLPSKLDSSLTTGSPSNFFKNGNRFAASIFQIFSSIDSGNGFPTNKSSSNVVNSCKRLNSIQSFTKLFERYKTRSFFKTPMPFSFSMKLQLSQSSSNESETHSFKFQSLNFLRQTLKLVLTYEPCNLLDVISSNRQNFKVSQAVKTNDFIYHIRGEAEFSENSRNYYIFLLKIQI